METLAKILLNLSFLLIPVLAQGASPVRYVQISTNAVSQQAGAFNVQSASASVGTFTFLTASTGTINSLVVNNTTSSGTFTAGGSTFSFTAGFVTGTKTDTSTTTLSGTDVFIGSTSIKGTATNDNAPAGFVGEAFSTATLDTNGVPASGSAQYFDVVSRTLTAGDWHLSGVFCASANGATITDFRTGISATSGNSATGLNPGDNNIFSSALATVSSDECVSIPDFRVQPTSNTTYYLKVRMSYSVATPKAYGRLSGVRTR